jgi:hypothetical protein
MNVKVINSSGLPMWVLVAAFFIVNTGTLAIQSLWKWKQTSRQAVSGLRFKWRLENRDLGYTKTAGGDTLWGVSSNLLQKPKIFSHGEAKVGLIWHDWYSSEIL